MRRLILISVLCALTALAVAGCGDDSTDTSSTDASSTAASGAVTISTKDSDIGTVLAGADGRTVYLFEADKDGKSACSGDCAAAWPPVVGEGKAGDGADAAKLGTIKREDGATQVTYGGMPLYYYVKDKDEADTYGQEVDSFGAEWYALTASGANASGEGAAEKSDDSKSKYGY